MQNIFFLNQSLHHPKPFEKLLPFYTEAGQLTIQSANWLIYLHVNEIVITDSGKVIKL